MIRLDYHPNFIRLKLPRDCQSPVSRAVIDDHGLLLAPDLAKRRVDAVPDALVGVIRGIRIGTSALM